MRRHARLRTALAAGALILGWQAMQAWSLGALGVPGFATWPVAAADAAGTRTIAIDMSSAAGLDDDPAPGAGVTVVEKSPPAPDAEAETSAAHANSQAIGEPDGPGTAAVLEIAAGTPFLQKPGSTDLPVFSGPVELLASWLPGAPSNTGTSASTRAPAAGLATTADDAGQPAPGLPEPDPRRRGGDERLPWVASATPEALTAHGGVARAAPARETSTQEPSPTQADLRSWIKSEAREAVGGVDAEGMPLYRFDLWIETPSEMRRRIASVAYDFDAPSAKPRSQASSDRDADFRVKFGGASCARNVVVTVTLEDGRQTATDVDGCAILN